MKMISIPLLTALTIQLSSFITPISGMSMITDIKLVGISGSATQSLPASYVKRIPRWHVLPNTNKLEPLKGTGPPASPEDEGFVYPCSTTDLWWPSDIPKLKMRPTLDVLTNNGIPQYVASGMDVAVPFTAADAGKTPFWRNYGLNSAPMASQWTTFGFSVEPGFRMECFIGRGTEGEDASDGEEEVEKTYKWNRLVSNAEDPNTVASDAVKMRNLIESMGIFFSGIEDDSPLSQGFHIVSFSSESETWTDLPIHSSAAEKDVYRLVCVATAEPDAEELLQLDDMMLGMLSTSIMKIDVSLTEAGGTSEFLPDAYRPLFVQCNA